MPDAVHEYAEASRFASWVRLGIVVALKVARTR
jgi:hypothetical protein